MLPKVRTGATGEPVIFIQDQFSHRIETHLIAFFAGQYACGDCHVCLPKTYWSIENQVLLLFDERDI